MIRYLKQNWLYLCLVMAVWICMACLILTFDKASLHLYLNRCHQPALDFIFRYYTLLAEFGPWIVAAALLFYKAGSAVYVVSAELLAGAVTQIVKNIVQAPRPKTFFNIAENPDILPLVDGVSLHSSFSFPSGHTTTFFALATVLILVFNSRLSSQWARGLMQCGLLLFALLGAYSRIYLSQHFCEDVFAGSLIGFTIATLLYPLFLRLQDSHPTFYNWHITPHKH